MKTYTVKINTSVGVTRVEIVAKTRQALQETANEWARKLSGYVESIQPKR